MTKRKAHFASEVELCATFIAQIGPDWVAYAETGGFDILLHRKADGFQIGVEAKLQFNREVLLQAMEGSWYTSGTGPDCRAILVPWGCSDALASVGAYIGLTVIRCEPKTEWGQAHFQPYLPTGRWDHDWYELLPTKRVKLPEFVPDVAAGSSAPVQLTEWKVGALKLAILLEYRGYLNREDFKRHHIDIRRWIAPGSRWLKPAPQGWVRDTHLPDFKKQHPKVWKEIKAKKESWMPPADLVKA